MVGEAGGARRQARRARLRLALAAAAALLAAWGCASAGDPPGGPPDTTPPTLLASVPESGAVLAVPPRRVELDFDEVIGERIAAPQPTIAGAVLVSPATTPVSVDWHRNHITISMKGGFRAGRVYRVELLPVVSDLRQNRMKTGRTVIFSTGPAIPTATLAGTVVDWVGGRAALGALVQAVLLPDSLPYLALADSAGNFSLTQMPPGDYLVYGVLDQNSNRRRDPREAFDTARVALADSAAVELYTFTHDTVGPRIRSADFVDSVTVRIVFDRPVSPDIAVDTSMVRVSPQADSTQTVPILRVYTPTAFDSATKAEAAARATAQAVRDSTARAEAARDTTHRRAAPPPLAPPGAVRPAGRLPPPLGAPRRDTTSAARRDTSRAAKMLARRPAPSDTRVLRLGAPLVPGARYAIATVGVIGLTGVAGTPIHTALTVPRPPPPRPAADSLRRAGADTAGARGRAAPPGATAPDSGPRAARADSLKTGRDSIPARPTPP